MNFKQRIYNIAIATAMLLGAQTAQAQDLLAKQAPIDRRMKAVDTLALQNLINRENAESPAAALYDGWDNKYAHRATELPETFKINLKHFAMPTTSRVITSNFGSRWGRQHKGLDIKVYIGDTIRAAFSGKVRIVRYEARGYGNYIVIRHNNGLETIYGHLSKQLVSENQVVRAGQPIGLGGNTGRSTGSHLHFETRLCGVALNPTLMFDFEAQDVTGDYYVFHRSTYQDDSRLANVSKRNSRNEEKSETTLAANRSGEALYHKVERGETLSSIAEKRGVTIEQLCRLNHITKRTRIRAGRILRYS